MPIRFPESKNFFFITIILLLLTPEFIHSQFLYFGRNKVHYEEFDWKVLYTDHFDIYYYGEMGQVAEIGAHYAEEVYEELKVKMNHIVTRRIPLIFYNTSNDFQQTNITPGLIPEGVGGFFEFLKGRVVLPSTGSLKDFQHVIRHELVHVFMVNKVYRVLKDHRIPTNKLPPLWFVEGLAEYFSTEVDATAEMLMRDAVINNYFVGIEDIFRIYGSFLMYKEGQSFLEFAGETYGKEKIAQVLENFWMYSSFTEVLEHTFGKPIERIDAEWLHYLKQKYFPLLKESSPTELRSFKFTRDGYNFTPVYYKFNKRHFIFYAANRDGYSSLYRFEVSPEYIPIESPQLILKGEQEEEFEAFHLFQSAIDVSDSGLIVFNTKKGGSDAIHFLSAETNELVKSYQNKDLIYISSPKFSSDGSKIVFHAVDRKGFSDIFMLELKTDFLYRITNDYYDDKDPVFGLNNNQVIFSSDRTGGKSKQKYNLFSVEIPNHEIKYITYLDANCNSPVVSPDKKKLLFVSDLDGVRNIYEIAIVEQSFGNKVTKISNFISGVFSPSFIDTSNITFSGFEKFSFNLYLLNLSKPDIDTVYTFEMDLESLPETWKATFISVPSENKDAEYEKEYALDFAQGIVTTDPVYGTRGGAVFSITDLLGDDRYYFVLYNTASVQSEILNSFNIVLQKVNFAGRVHYGFGIFNMNGYVYDITDPDLYFYERSFGGSFFLGYPLTKFHRLEATATIQNSNKEVIPNVIERKAMLFTNTLGYVFDNSLWGPTGPIDGMRALVYLGYTSDIKYSNVNYFSVIGDFRNYLRIGYTTLLAFRAAAFYNEGKEARMYFMGGSWDLRGWPRFGIRGEKLWLSSLEFRFPLIDQIGLRFPFFNIGFFGLRGALFFDMGGILDEFYETTFGSLGWGFRMNIFGVLTLRYDMGKRIEKDFTEFQGGLFYQFFFGWDF